MAALSPSQATKVQEVDADYDPSFLRHIFPRIEWPTLREAAEVMGALCIFPITAKP